MSDDIGQIEQQLEELDKKSEECFQKCQIASAIRIAKEATRMAKSHSLAVHYMRGLFDQMRFGHGILNPQATREVSVELVLLLEDEEYARRVQPNLDEGHYHWLCSWMSTCAYDNLAEATGMMVGCNSEGMHQCINDGLQICRQTGKMECIKCFREYAADVYLAADDFEMVRHQCQTFLEYASGGNDNKDRRWSGRHKLAKLLMLEGRHEQAIEELNKAFELAKAEDVYLKLRSRSIVAATLDEALILSGQPRFDWEELEKELPGSGEWPYIEYLREVGRALALVVDKDYDAAIELLTQLDRRLTEQNCRKEWFEVRLRLVAAYLLSGNRKRAESLAKGLEATADEAQDFLTLRRLKRLMDEGTNVSPIAAVADSQSQRGTDSDAVAVSSVTDEPSDEEFEDDATPLADQLTEYMQRIMQVHEDEEVRQQLLADFLSHKPEEIESHKDAAYLVHLSQFIVRGTEDAQRVWPWAKQMIDRFPDAPVLMSVVAALGYYFRTADTANFESITLDQLEKWFRMSTTPKVEHAKNFARAGSFFMDEGDLGEAERNYSRGFRLDRKELSIVLPLSELYRQSDRMRDALAVLDLSLREGNDDQAVAWEATMAAVQLEQWDAVRTYIDKFLALGEADTWIHYYQALASFHLGKYEQSLKEIELERDFSPPGDFHLLVLKVCNLLCLERGAEARDAFKEVLAIPFRSVEYFSLNQLMRTVGLLWTTATKSSAGTEELQQLEHHMLAAGLLPDEYFDQQREEKDTEEAVLHYLVQIHQPLDEEWQNSPGCLNGQENWTDYDAEWGVLAQDEEQAINAVLAYQSRCYQLPVEIVHVQTDEQEYRDRPGVVWQGIHWSQADLQQMDENDMELDDFGDQDFGDDD